VSAVSAVSEGQDHAGMQQSLYLARTPFTPPGRGVVVNMPHSDEDPFGGVEEVVRDIVQEGRLIRAPAGAVRSRDPLGRLVNNEWCYTPIVHVNMTHAT
jgi:hypothetical protein